MLAWYNEDVKDVTIRLSQAEYEWFETVAAKDGVGVEEWCTAVLREQARRAGGVASNQDEIDIHEMPTRPDIKR